MMFKNSFRLFCANFDKVWKMLVYQLFCWGITFALLTPFYNLISTNIINVWNDQDLALSSYFVSGTFYGLNIIKTLYTIINAIIGLFANLFASNLFATIYILAILFLIRPFFVNIGKYTIDEMMYGYMSSSSKISFTGSLLRTLKRSVPYALLKTFYTLPFDALVLGSIYGMTLITVDAFAYVLPLMIVLIPSLLLAFKETFVAGWAPASIVFDEGTFKSYRKGMVAVFRRVGKVYSSAFVIFVLTLTLAMILGLYSLIIILPCIAPLLCIFEMVVFFSSQGMRFYVDADTILSPKKLEEIDTIEKAKFLL